MVVKNILPIISGIIILLLFCSTLLLQCIGVIIGLHLIERYKNQVNVFLNEKVLSSAGICLIFFSFFFPGFITQTLAMTFSFYLISKGLQDLGVNPYCLLMAAYKPFKTNYNNFN